MKLEKALLAAYLFAQCLMALWMFTAKDFTLAYIIVALITIALFTATHFRDPGFLQVDQNRQAQVTDDFERDEEIPEKSPKLSKRFCRICMINQPYRTKHCHECDKCVATFDHHCPWMATCIGQKNRPIYLLYLYAQSTQIFIAALAVCTIALNKIGRSPYQFVLGIILILLLSMLIGLTIFQTYLMLINLTTWQLAKWDTIEYLNKKQKGEGSPFSKGPVWNTAEYWIWGFRVGRKIWEFESE